jgi:uncharacterized membrane protein
MTWQFTVYAYIYILTGIVVLVTALMNCQHRDQSGLDALAKALFFISIWALAAGRGQRGALARYQLLA